MAQEKPNWRLGKPIEFQISLMNATSHIGFRAGRKTTSKGTSETPREDWLIHLIEVTDSGILLEGPRDCGCRGEKVDLRIQTQGSEKLDLSFSGSITRETFESQSSPRGSIYIEFDKFDEEGWEKLRGLFGSRQSEVLRVFEALKGQ